MKKLHLNKIFHWLYAFLMFIPVFGFFYYFISNFGTGSYPEAWLENVFQIDNQLFDVVDDTLLFGTVQSLFDYIALNIFGLDFEGISTAFAFALDLMCYWICVSLAYLIFDVVMLPINIAHHWIDKGSDRL